MEVSWRRRQGARPKPQKMYTVPVAWAWWPAVVASLAQTLGVSIHAAQSAASFGHSLENQCGVTDAVQRSAQDALALRLSENARRQAMQSSPRVSATAELFNGTHEFRFVSPSTEAHFRATDQARVRSGISPRGRLQSSAHALRSGACSGRFGRVVLPISSSASSATPNPSVKLSANGRPPSPSHRYGVHFLWLGLGVLPSSPAYLQR